MGSVIGVRRMATRGRLLFTMVALAAGAAGCPPPGPPAGGDLEVLIGEQVIFNRSVTSDPVALNAAQLGSAAIFPLPAETIRYNDAFSTTASPTLVVTMARDPHEFKATLESIRGARSPGGFVTQIIEPVDQSISPVDNFPTDAVSLPDAYVFPYGGGLLRSDLSVSDYTEGFSSIVQCPPSSSFNGNSCYPWIPPFGIQGIYLERLGVCAQDVSIQTQVVNQLTQMVPEGILTKIIGTGGVANEQSDVDVAAFVDSSDTSSPYGGFVLLSNTYVQWNVPGATPANVSIPYTFRFELSDGILATSPHSDGDQFDGYAGGQVFSGINGALASTIADTIYLNALSQQAQPIPKSALTEQPPECTNGTTHPSSCYIPCNLPDGFNAPPDLSPGSTDDTSWHYVQVCTGGFAGLGCLMTPQQCIGDTCQYQCQRAVSVLEAGATTGAGKAGITNGTQISNIAALFDARRTSANNVYENVRCNYHPTYVSDGTPVCEVVVHAKRLDVTPSTVELVWFDGSDLAHIGSEEYGNEAFATYLALLAAPKGDTSKLCGSLQNLFTANNEFPGPSFERFAHGSGSCAGTPPGSGKSCVHFP